MSDIKRSYIIEHFEPFVRAYHGHVRERKYVQVLDGVFKVVMIPLELLEHKKDELETHYLEPGTVICVPEGYANGFKNLTSKGKIQFFSNKTLQESLEDDIRYPWDWLGTKVWEAQYG